MKTLICLLIGTIITLTLSAFTTGTEKTTDVNPHLKTDSTGEDPELIVQEQLKAYNARNIEAFLATYSDQIKIYDYSGKLIIHGKDQMRIVYADYFKHTDLRCDIEERMIINNKVAYKEKVTRGSVVIYTVAIYEILDGKIHKVIFVQ